MAYLDREADAELEHVARDLFDRTGRPATFGWGPRFLHSTGQYHKGGPPDRRLPAGHDHPGAGPRDPGPRLHLRRAHRGPGRRRRHGARRPRPPGAAPAPHRARRRPGPGPRGTRPGPRVSPARVAAGANPLRDPRDKRLPRIAGPCSLVLFGVTGDLARKKLMPAIYDLANRGPAAARVRARRVRPARLGRPGLRQDRLRVGARARPHPVPRGGLAPLAEGIRFVPGSFDDDASFDLLAQDDRRARRAARHRRQPRVLPVDPADVVRHGLPAARALRARRPAEPGSWRRVVIEKPFGHDLKSARELNAIVENVFPPDAVFRIDHYLGKETVQNILALRFANQLFEPIWNANYVDHVQITMAEDIGIGGRAGYYDGIGAARDVIQNHLLQLLALTAMEEPVSFDAAGPARREGEGALGGPAARRPRDRHRPRAVRRRLAGRRGGRRLPRGGRHGPPTRRTETLRRDARSTSTPAAGPACRSTCAPASGSAAGSPRSRWCSSGPRTCRSPTRPPRSSARTPS